MARTSPASTLVVGGPPRVNLMPPAELERRGRRTLLKNWALGLCAVAVVTLLVIGAAVAMQFVENTRLDAERARTDSLIVEIASLAAVSKTVTTSGELTDYREAAMTADLEWAGLLESLGARLPADVTVIGFDVTAGSGPDGEDPATAPGATILLTLASPAAFDIVPATRGIRDVPTVLRADGTEVRFDDSRSRYISELTIVTTQEAYSGRFAPEEDAG